MTPEEIKRELRKALDELNLRGFEGAAKINIDTNDVDHLNSLLNLANSKLSDLKSSAEDVADGFRSIADTFSKISENASGLAKRGLNNLVRSTAQAKSFQDAIIEGHVDEKRILNEIDKITRNRNLVELDRSGLSKTQIGDMMEQSKRLLAILNVQKDITYEASRQAEFVSNMANGLAQIPIIGKSISKPFKNVTEEIQKAKTSFLALNNQLSFYIEERKKEKNKGKQKELDAEIRALKSRIKTLPSIRQILNNEIKAIANISNIARSIGALFIGVLVKELVAADKSATELARKFNMSKSAALELRNNIRDANIEQGSYLTTTNDVLQTMMSLQDTTGRFVALRQQDLQTATELLKVVGLTEKATAGLTQMSQINNTSLKDTEKSILGSSVQLQAQTGLFIDNKQLLEDIGGLSDTLRVKFKNNAEEMALTVTRSRQLGFSMEALSGVQDNILNFESSIAAELEAELLTGKELNLEKARYYALTNQQSKLQDEIVRQVGTLTEYTDMNVLQQKAYAQALGMSVDDLSKILLTQEQNAAIQKEINKDQKLASLFDGQVNKEKLIALAKSGDLSREQLDALGEATGENLRQLSIQEKMEKTMTRLSEIFLSVMDPVLSIVDAIDKVITGIGEMFNSLPEGARKGLGGALALLGGGAFIGSIVKLLTRGTLMNPMITANVGMGGGMMTGMMGKLASGLGLTGMAQGARQMMNPALRYNSAGRLINSTGYASRSAAQAAGMSATGGIPSTAGVMGGFKTLAVGLARFSGILSLLTEGAGLVMDAFSAFGEGGGGFKEFFSGKNIGRILGGIAGGVIASPTGIGIPAGIGIGAMVGGMLGNLISPGNAVEKVSSSPRLSTFATPVESVTPMATGGIVTSPTRALVGEAGSEAVIPLDAFYRKFDELIAETRKPYQICVYNLKQV
jgi:hypothetical protein